MWRKLVWANVVVLGLVLAGGCANDKAQMDKLTLEKQGLEDQLRQNKGELDDKQAELAKCQDQLAQAKAERDALQQKLAGMGNQPAPQTPVPAGWEIRKGMVMTSLPEAVLFHPGRAELLSSAQSKLNTVIHQIQANFPGRDVYVVGHTDSDPIRRTKKFWTDNLDLSLNRSAAVTRYLITHGLSSKQVIAAGAGEFRPVVKNTAKGKARNRRVEFWILKPM